jgi:hypothetical protein
MVTTAHWLHLRLGLPLIDIEPAPAERASEETCSAAEIIALQRAYATAPLAVQFVGR